jgi:hypothetical protein
LKPTLHEVVIYIKLEIDMAASNFNNGNNKITIKINLVLKLTNNNCAY